MLFRTTIIAALLAITPALATLSERSVEEPVELSIRSDMDEDALVFARALQEEPELERRLFGFLAKLAVKGAVKAGKAAAHHHHNKHHKRDIESVEELFERDLEFDDELFERSLEGEEELELFERDYENLEELD